MLLVNKVELKCDGLNQCVLLSVVELAKGIDILVLSWWEVTPEAEVTGLLLFVVLWDHFLN